MPQHVTRLGGDQVLGLEDLPGCELPLLGLPIFRGATYFALVLGVKRYPVDDELLRAPLLVADRHSRAVIR